MAATAQLRDWLVVDGAVGRGAPSLYEYRRETSGGLMVKRPPASRAARQSGLNEMAAWSRCLSEAQGTKFPTARLAAQSERTLELHLSDVSASAPPGGALEGRIGKTTGKDNAMSATGWQLPVQQRPSAKAYGRVLAIRNESSSSLVNVPLRGSGRANRHFHRSSGTTMHDRHCRSLPCNSTSLHAGQSLCHLKRLQAVRFRRAAVL